MAEKTFEVEFDGYWREQDIEGIPNGSGAYCVYECTYNKDKDAVSIHKLIYIGEAADVRDRIQNHEKWHDWKKHVREDNELCFSYGHVESEYRERVEAALVFRHKPPENTEYTDTFPFDKTTIILSGKTKLLNTYFTVEKTP